MFQEHPTRQNDEGEIEYIAEVEIPKLFLCPITKCLMHDPVIFFNDSKSYEREALEEWLKEKKTNPITNAPLENPGMFANGALRDAINEFVQKHKDSPNVQDFRYISKQQRLNTDWLKAARQGASKQQLAEKLKAGANPLATDNQGNTALHVACRRKNPLPTVKAIFELLSSDNVINPAEYDEKKADVGDQPGMSQMAWKLLLKANTQGDTPLQTAMRASPKNKQLIPRLLQYFEQGHLKEKAQLTQQHQQILAELKHRLETSNRQLQRLNQQLQQYTQKNSVLTQQTQHQQKTIRELTQTVDAQKKQAENDKQQIVELSHSAALVIDKDQQIKKLEKDVEDLRGIIQALNDSKGGNKKATYPSPASLWNQNEEKKQDNEPQENDRKTVKAAWGKAIKTRDLTPLQELGKDARIATLILDEMMKNSGEMISNYLKPMEKYKEYYKGEECIVKVIGKEITCIEKRGSFIFTFGLEDFDVKGVMFKSFDGGYKYIGNNKECYIWNYNDEIQGDNIYTYTTHKDNKNNMKMYDNYVGGSIIRINHVLWIGGPERGLMKWSSDISELYKALTLTQSQQIKPQFK